MEALGSCLVGEIQEKRKYREEYREYQHPELAQSPSSMITPCAILVGFETQSDANPPNARYDTDKRRETCG